MPWVILDSHNGRKHIPVVFTTRHAALSELLELLKPYPRNSEWHLRLYLWETHAESE
jgi:hypothetical protein